MEYVSGGDFFGVGKSWAGNGNFARNITRTRAIFIVERA